MGARRVIMVTRGRPKALTEVELIEAQKLYWEEGLPVRDIADALEVSHMTIWRAICQQQAATG